MSLPSPRAHEAALALSAVAVLLLGLQSATDLQRAADPRGAAPTSSAAPPDRPVAAAPAAAPVAVTIADLDLAELLVPLGRQSDGSLAVPTDFGDVGVWAQPGGPVVLAGHVDSDAGPAVFFRLRELAPGDEVVVRTAAGARQAYVVERVEQHAKDAFPTFEVFAGTGLRLITCAGAFDRRAGSYRDNLVVYARPA